MPWARFEDDYLGNRKLATLSTEAIALDMASIVYSARELRDGLLSEGDVQTVAALIHLRKWKPAVQELMAVKRWEAVGDVHVIHDYLSYQPSRERVLADRAAAADRKRHARSPGNVRPDNGRDSGRIPNGIHADSARSSAGVRPESGDPVPGPGTSVSLNSTGSSSSSLTGSTTSTPVKRAREDRSLSSNAGRRRAAAAAADLNFSGATDAGS